MATDYDDNILLDSDEDFTKPKKTKDFIPKPRLLTAPANKLASIAGHSQTTQAEESQRTTVDSREHSGSVREGQSKDFIDTPSVDPEVKVVATTASSNGSVHKIGHKETEATQVCKINLYDWCSAL